MKNKLFTLLIMVLAFVFSANAQKAVNFGADKLPEGQRVAKKAPVALEDIMPWVGVRDAKNCQFRVVLTDSYGDGWGGNTLTVLVNGTEVAGSPFTIVDGAGPEEYSFTATDGDMVTTTHAGDDWPTENDWVVYDGADNAIITGNGEGNPTIESDLGVCPTGFDLGVPMATPSFVSLGETAIPQVTVHNYGGEVAVDFDVTLTFDPGYNETMNFTGEALDPGMEMVVDFPAWTPADGSYVLTATVAIVDDNNAANDIYVGSCDVFPVGEYAVAGNTSVGEYAQMNLADASMTPVGAIGTDPFPMAEEFADGMIYRVYNNLSLVSVNPDDGVTTALGTITGMAGTPTGLAYDAGLGVMYVVVLDGSNEAHLGTLDLATYEATEIGIPGGMVIAMDLADDGMLYAPTLGDVLLQIDPIDGVATEIGPLGIDINFGQDVSFDAVSGKLLTISCGAVYSYGYYDMSTGAFSAIVADMGGNQYATFTTYEVAEPGPTVTFNVDMNDSITSGYFVPGTDMVYTTGSFTGWDEPGTGGSLELLDGDDDGIYSVVLEDLADGDYEYKYFKNAGWDNGEWDGGDNRTFTLAGEDVVLNDVFGPQSVGVETLDAGISVYPNPSNGVFNVTASSNVTLEVLDITGKLVMVQNINGNTQVKLDNAGMYFFRFSNENGSAVNKVIVK